MGIEVIDARTIGTIDKSELEKAQKEAMQKLTVYRDAYYDPNVDKTGLKDAANSAIAAMASWIDKLQELNGQLSSAGLLMTEMLFAENDQKPKKKN